MAGLNENTDYGLRNASFKKGDKLLLFTDGLFEEFSTTGEETGKELGEEGLFKIIEKYKLNKPENLIKNILSDIEAWRSGNPVNDDITVIGIEYL